MSEQFERFVAAVVQASPVFLDRDATIAKAVRLIAEAATMGARLIVLPEAFVPGYPFWLWGDRPGTVDRLEQRAFARLWRESIEVPGPATEALAEAACNASAYVAIGANEREAEYGRSTLYNTLLLFGPDGTLIGRHRKLVPTYRERTVWGQGDGSELRVHSTEHGRVGGLICWENFMPLARYHAYAQGEQVHLAVTVDDSEIWEHLMRTIAAEGRVFVLSASQVFRRSDWPDEPLLSGFAPEADVVCSGGSLIVGAGGSILAGPLRNDEGILTAEIDLERVIEEKHSLDVTGHYARPDLFKLSIDESPRFPFVAIDR